MRNTTITVSSIAVFFVLTGQYTFGFFDYSMRNKGGNEVNSKIGMGYGRLMLDVQGHALTADEKIILTHPQVGGVILFSRNIDNVNQVIALVAEIRAYASNILIAVDQEGGRVQRLRQGFTRLPPMQSIGDLTAEDEKLGLSIGRDLGWLMASEVLACGVDISFAPVLDVDRLTSSIIGDRAFSDQPGAVIKSARAFIQGMHEAGMAATGKHFPGHGGIVADSHLEAPVDHRDWAVVNAHDMVPFRALAGELDGVMPAHITFPKVDSMSVGFSWFWLNDVLRKDIGFKGVIFSDDLSMKGADVVGGYVEKAQCALNAGCDMILVCNHPQAAQEVLRFMDSKNISLSLNIKAMRASKTVTWENLLLSKRRARTIRRLATMM
ncbi:MAG: beta-N-acetylhexosaminidase [Porticoccaceae bacterium]|nr:beta-N-acetylhexosaminidase [Porticoccaceae bacterium]MDG1474511.1 beta-N-acetylhexosaminidase [Porticoccaceae bacterium]